MDEERERLTWKLINSRRFKVDDKGNPFLDGKRIPYNTIVSEEFHNLKAYFLRRIEESIDED